MCHRKSYFLKVLNDQNFADEMKGRIESRIDKVFETLPEKYIQDTISHLGGTDLKKTSICVNPEYVIMRLYNLEGGRAQYSEKYNENQKNRTFGIICENLKWAL